MATVMGHDLQLQTVQKLMTKAMLPLVRMADRFCLAASDDTTMPNPTEALNACLDSFSLLAGANLQMDQLRREGFKSALPPQYKGPEVPTELLFGDFKKRMKLDEKVKLEDNLKLASFTPKVYPKVNTNPRGGKAFTPRSTTKGAYPASTGSENLCRFPTMENLSTTSGKQTGRKSYNHRKSR